MLEMLGWHLSVVWLREGSAAPPEMDARIKNVFLHLQLRGASFAQDLARATGLATAEVLAALWELFWAGMVTPDTFSAIVAGMTPPRRAPEAGLQRRRRRGHPNCARRAPRAECRVHPSAR